MELIRNLLSEIDGIPEEHIQRYIDLSEQKHYPAGSYLLREGDVSTQVAYIQSGLFRYMYATKEGDYTIHFFSEQDFIGNCIAAKQSETSTYSIQCIEDSILMEVNYNTWVAPFVNDTWWVNALLMFREYELALMEIREKEMHSLDAKARYIAFKKRYPNLEPRLKQHMIATYLGINPVSLSRIKTSASL